FSWVKSYAALGDSFAAGIGAGERRGSAFDQEWQCSRYSDAYPLKIQDVVEADNFKFLACTGAVIDNIVQDQVPQLNQNAGLWDLITVSAGGNDVGFGDVLKACLFLPNGLSNKAACQKALADAESKIDTVLTPSVNKLLGLLEGKLNYKGVIVWTLYAPFFNLSPEPCNSQGWCFVASAWCMSPDVALRTEFNRLVTKTNDKLIEALGNWKTNNRFRKLQWADWGGITEMANGQFCEPDGAANVADDSNSKLAFIRFN
ncbi:SGNH hydrolase-type esterase domain-containing protein, partial [Boeremia exigua]|uniref:SGNH hydrolase-type esterase domain-containing protein n=1 Tax=Boeremia exigua TaxID=749465 RepID=UPI001E8EC4EC